MGELIHILIKLAEKEQPQESVQLPEAVLTFL